MSYNKYITRRSGILIPLLSILLIACQNKEQKPSKATSSTNAVVPKLPVDIIIANEQELNQEEAVVGTMLPYREVSIMSELPQKITKVAFKDGSYVNQGAVLYTLNNAAIRSQLKQIGAELKLARLDKDRLGNLLKTETVRQQEYDEGLMRLHSLEAQEELLHVELAKTVIKAPFSGKIGISKVYEGAYVSPSMELVTLQDQNRVKINFSVPERYLSLIRIGSQIKFNTELSDQQYSATISATEPGLDSSRSLQVQAISNNTNGQFRAGLSAKVYFPITTKGSSSVMIPTEALIPSEKGYTVFVIKKGLAKPIAITITNRTETDAIITSGIKTGDSIIISNTLRLGDGTAVKAVTSK